MYDERKKKLFFNILLDSLQYKNFAVTLAACSDLKNKLFRVYLHLKYVEWYFVNSVFADSGTIFVEQKTKFLK